MWKEKPYFQYIPKFQTKWKLSLENKRVLLNMYFKIQSLDRTISWFKPFSFFCLYSILSEIRF